MKKSPLLLVVFQNKPTNTLLINQLTPNPFNYKKQISVEGYFKTFENIVEYKDGAC